MKCSKKVLSGLITIFLVYTSQSFAETTSGENHVAAPTAEELQKQIDKLKKIQDDDIAGLEEELEEVNIRDEHAMKLSGYADVEYRSKTGKPAGFRIHHLSLFATKKINNKFSFFSEIEFEDGPKFEDPVADGQIFLEAMNIDYKITANTSLKMGRFFTPAGIWSIDHYPPFVSTQERPIHIRRIFPQLIDGLDLFGVLPIGKTFLNYDVYLGNGEGNNGHGDNNSSKGIGTKISWILPFLKHTEIGATYYSDTLNSGEDKKAKGVHTKIQYGQFTLKAEYAKATFSQSTANKTGKYVQLMYDIDDFSIGFRYDKDNSKKPYTIKRNSYIANYHVTDKIVVKFEHHVDDAQSKTTHEDILSIAVFLD